MNFTRFVEVCCLTVRGERHLDAATASRTQLALPLTCHRGIHCGLFARFRGRTRLAAVGQVLIHIHGGATCHTHLLLDALAGLAVGGDTLEG